MMLLSFLALGYLAYIRTTSGVPSEWGSLIPVIGEMIFLVGIIVILIGVGELLTGNMMAVGIA